MRKILFLIIIYLTITNCLVKNSEAADYTRNFVSLNKSILEQFKDYDERQILYGNLNPNLENKLFKDSSDNLYLIVNGKSINGRNMKLQIDSFEKKNSDYFLRIDYKKLTWNKENLYQIKRRQKVKIGEFKPSIVWESLAKIIQENPSNSLTQKKLCMTFECLVEETKDYKILSYEFTEKTKKAYPEFYEKYANRFDQLKFRTVVIPNGDYSIPIVIENSNRKLILKFPKSGEDIWKNPRRLNFVLDFSLKTFGLTFNVQRMQYILNYNKNKNTETLSGQFYGTPEYNLDGRFFYIIPQGLVDFFIPGNIEEYLDKGLTLLTVGTDGKSGNRFKANYYGKGISAYYNLESSSETYQKRFSLFSSKKDPDKKSPGDIEYFIQDLWKEISKDLDP